MRREIILVTEEQFKSPYYNLKTIIENCGKTQMQVADELGINRTTFNLKINRSNGRDFTFDEAIRLSMILSEKVDNFF